MAHSTAAKQKHRADGAGRHSRGASKPDKGESDALSATRRASERNLDQQIQIPVNALIALVVMHMLSSPSSLSLAHLSTHLHLPQSLHLIIPSWLRMPSLAPFASDLPNASERGSHIFQQYAQHSSFGAAGPFRSDARGFGHPLTALHNFTRAALGLSYPVPDPKQSPIAAMKHEALSAFEKFGHGVWANRQEPWALMRGVDGYVYGRGAKDVFVVITMVLIFTALRAILMKYLLLPMGERCVPPIKAAEHEKKSAASARSEARDVIRARKTREKEVLRFAEQGFNLIYYVCSWSMGLYIASRESYWPMKTSEYWTDFPAPYLSGLNKIYYLAEGAFYVQQLFVLNVEARRSDHWQMFSHHVITIALIAGSYAQSLHRVGNAILILMDPSDIFLALAKMLKYSGLQTVCDAAFGVFMLSWLVTRHVLYVVVLRSCMVEVSPELVLERTGEWLLGHGMYYGLVSLLWGLQVILMMWFAMILRVLYRVLTKAGAVDSRSDDESSDDEGEEQLHQPHYQQQQQQQHQQHQQQRGIGQASREDDLDDQGGGGLGAATSATTTATGSATPKSRGRKRNSKTKS
ncbi:Sphingosine N-acyltransferase lag1 [Thecaphora frezii]